MRKKESPIDFIPHRSLLAFIKKTIYAERYSLCKALYKCKCGNEIEAYIGNVKSGKTLSCGCHKKSVKTNIKHGLSDHPLYSVWENMTSRCYNKKVRSYNSYGGRGVSVCKEWLENPEKFIRWGIDNGWKSGLQLDKDKIGNGLLYSPEICVFITPKENSNNRRTNKKITFNGETKTLAQWADSLGMTHPTLCVRLQNWSIERSLTQPIKNIK